MNDYDNLTQAFAKQSDTIGGADTAHHVSTTLTARQQRQRLILLLPAILAVLLGMHPTVQKVIGSGLDSLAASNNLSSVLVLALVGVCACILSAET